MLGVSLASMQIRIPIFELRRMTKHEMGTMVTSEANSLATSVAGPPLLTTFKRQKKKKLSLIGQFASTTHRQKGSVTMQKPLGTKNMQRVSKRQAEAAQPLERMIGTALLLAYLEVTRTVKAAQLAAQLSQLNELKWEKAGHSFEWFLKAFRVMMGLRQTSGWYYRSILWNFVFLQQRNGSFELTDTLATVLGAGDTTYLIVNNPTGGWQSTEGGGAWCEEEVGGGGMCRSVDRRELQEKTPQMLYEQFGTGDKKRCAAAARDDSPDGYLGMTWRFVDGPKPTRAGWIPCCEWPESDGLWPTGWPEEGWPSAKVVVASETVLDDDDLAELTKKAEKAVKRWNEDRMSTIRALKWNQEANKSKIAKPLQGGAFAEPPLSVHERRRELVQEAKRLSLLVLRTHPWSKIMVTGPEEPYTRSQRILVQCTSILLMLVVCLGIYYSKALPSPPPTHPPPHPFLASALRQCGVCCLSKVCILRHSLETAEGGVYEGMLEYEVLHDESFDMCSTLMESEMFDCHGFDCDPHEQLLPHGYACTAFPQATLRDEIYMAIFVVVSILPVQMFFMALFTAGQQYRVPKHWARARADINTGQVLDGAFLLLQRVGRMLNTARRRFYSMLWFVYQTRALGRAEGRVFAELHQRLKEEEARLLREGRAQTIFEQARNEIDSVSVQICYALLMVLWVGITYILLVYGMLIRKLMGSSTEKKVLEAWVITLVFDNLVMQVVKSLTIKVWIQWLIKKFKAARAGEEFLMHWFEGYINSKLPAAYRTVQSDAASTEMEYDAAGIDF
ncbi:hypothetical protein CYMTET_50555 [Cymbomonas tetramitiformis]|uniref:Uncharacterized protein n=1 Tax=Cymbomonas tetramitiformis TaxID=36881 RepID=A0AAE0BPI6_9CHLO|nr:hypothetical protein CYMTET_50555 [Cymbomonas tetramitiformis]